MKKKIFGIVAVAAFAGALAFNSIANSNKTALSAVTLKNIEALTRDEIKVALCTMEPDFWCCEVPGRITAGSCD